MEQTFDEAVHKLISNLVGELNQLISNEVNKNMETVEGMQICCKLEEFRSRLIDYLGNEAYYLI